MKTEDKAKVGCGIIFIILIGYFGVIGFVHIISSWAGTEGISSSNQTLSCTSSKIPSAVLKKINQNIPVYKKAAAEVDIPWEMIAGIHFRETSNGRTTPRHNSGDGVYQILSKDYPYPAGQELTDEQFLVETVDAAKFIKGKSRPEKFGGKELSQITVDAELIKDTFWGYNGRAYGSSDNSPYVMNNFDEAHMNMPIITRDGGGIDGRDTRNGAYTIFVALKGGCSGTTTDDATTPAGEKEGSVGYFFDFIDQKAGKKFGVSSGCQDDRNGGKRTHNGYDFTAPIGTPVHTPYSGKITYVGDWYKGDGRQAGGDSVRLKKDSPDKDGALYYQFTHINPNAELKVGQTVKQGDLIGKVKSLASGPHVDMKKSNLADVPTNARICRGGTEKGLPKDKYKIW